MAIEDRPETSGSAASTGNESSSQGKRPRRSNAIARYLKLLGPGLITGASDDDPSGIGTYLIAGAQLGFATLWTALVTFPLMAAVQLICARIGLVTKKGIGTILREHFSRKLLFVTVAALVIANTINAGADILAIAAGVNLIVPIPINVALVPIAILIVALQIWGSYRLIASVFKWLCLSLFAYIAAALMAKPDWAAVLAHTFVPTIHLNSGYLATLVAILGTTISPYLFFWQASQEVEEHTEHGRKWPWQRRRTSNRELTNAAWDVNSGMLLSNVVMYFIILAAATTLHHGAHTEINSAAEAAEALRPLAGNGATMLMALGLIGSGLLAVPVLTGSAAYAVCEACNWKCSFDDKPFQAKQFYLILTGSTLGGLLLNLFGINPMDALYWTAVINGLLAPPLLLIIMLISNKRAIMGDRVNGPVLNTFGWLATAVMFAAALGLLLTWGVT